MECVQYKYNKAHEHSENSILWCHGQEHTNIITIQKFLRQKIDLFKTVNLLQTRIPTQNYYEPMPHSIGISTGMTKESIDHNPISTDNYYYA